LLKRGLRHLKDVLRAILVLRDIADSANSARVKVIFACGKC
jgi:hypothetical protein